MIVLDFEDEAAFLSEHTNCTFEEALGYVLVEDDYLDSLGLCVYPDENGLYETADKKNDVGGTAPTVDVSKMNVFISEKTGLPLEKCDELASAEVDYFTKIGLIEFR